MKKETNENREPKEEKREISNLPSTEDIMDPNLPSNKLNKLKEKQKIFKDYPNKNEVQNEGMLQRPPITPVMQEHPVQKGD